MHSDGVLPEVERRVGGHGRDEAGGQGARRERGHDDQREAVVHGRGAAQASLHRVRARRHTTVLRHQRRTYTSVVFTLAVILARLVFRRSWRVLKRCEIHIYGRPMS